MAATANEMLTCTRCGTTGTDHGDWNGQFKSGRVVAIICPACQSPEQNAEAEINAATIVYGTDAFGRLAGRSKT
jgi:hypothetical protein